MQKRPLILIIFLLLMLLQTGDVLADADATNVSPDPETLTANDAEKEEKDFSFTQDFYVEWFTLKAMGGTYGGGAGIDFFTLNWKWFYWDIVHSYFVGGMPSLQTNTGYRSGLFATGMMVGVPIRFDPEGRHEFRIGLGLLGGWMFSGLYEYSCVEQEIASSYGPLIAVEIAYLYRIYRHFSIYSGFSIVTAVRHDMSPFPSGSTCVGFHERSIMPWPMVSAFFGFKI